MLRELSVQNLALIEDARVELQPGYCAWTGETGAGKSLLLTALSLVLGGRASSDLVRAGKPEARAAAVFDVSEPMLRIDVETLIGGPIDDDTPPLPPAQAQRLLTDIPGWSLSDGGKALHMERRFADFMAVVGFINRLAPVVEADRCQPCSLCGRSTRPT